LFLVKEATYMQRPNERMIPSLPAFCNQFCLVFVVRPHTFSQHFLFPPPDQGVFGATREGNPMWGTGLPCLNEAKIDSLLNTGEMTIGDYDQTR
jgi:hypothetical protein